MAKKTLAYILSLGIILGVLTGCAATVPKKSSGVVTSREATDIWHSYEVLPKYNYYYAGPASQPNYLIGIEDQYRLVTEFWKPVDLTPEMLKNWFNYIRPRVGFSQNPYGAFINDPDGNRIGLWYSVRDWRLTGTAVVSADNEVAVTIPTIPTERRRRASSCKF